MIYRTSTWMKEMGRFCNMSTSPLQRSMLNTQVYDLLKERIIDGVLTPGQRLNIDGLARELGVSNIPVREALARLAVERLILVEPFKGYTVTPLFTAERLAQLFETRLLIETHAASIGAAHVSQADIYQMRGILEQMEELQEIQIGPSYHEFKLFNRGDHDFHTLIVSSGGNSMLSELYEHLSPHLHLSRLYGVRGEVDAAEAVREHRAIFTAFTQHDVEATVAAVKEHLSGSHQRLEVALKQTWSQMAMSRKGTAHGREK